VIKIKTNYNKINYKCTAKSVQVQIDVLHLRSQQFNQVVWSLWIWSKGRASHVSSSMPPALVPIMGAVGADGSGERLAKHDGAVGLLRGHNIAGRLAHHAHNVQRAVDLGKKTRGLTKGDLCFHETFYFTWLWFCATWCDERTM
jgi:hypothetical protein